MKSKFPIIYIFYSTLLIAVFLLAYSFNPPNGRTNAPGDGYCTDCHTPGNPLGLDGDIYIENFPSTIEPNTDYTITVKVTNPNGLAQRGGFQAVVLDELNQNIGDLSLISGNNPSTSTTGSREYIEHNPALTFPNSNEVSWDFIWTSPIGPDEEVIKMYAAGNIANGGAGSSNDLVKSTIAEGVIVGGSNLTVDIFSSTDVSCFGGDDGTATASVSNGTPPYSYLWSNNETTSTAVNLSAGLQSISVTDNDGFTAVASTTISQPPILTTDVITTNIDCNNATATATALVTGGTPPYTYDWPSGNTQPTESNLPPGTYTLTVTDDNLCQDTETFTIAEDTSTPIAEAGPDQLLTCSGNLVELDGSASSTGSNITYLWSTLDGNIVSGENTNVAEVNQAGTYTLTVSDTENGCSAEDNVQVSEAGMIVLEIEPNPVLCNGGSSGSIDLTVSGGEPPYTYNWNDPNNQTVQDPVGLTAGFYCVTVTDDNNCTATICTTIEEPSAINIEGEVSEVSCSNSCDGEIDITVNGGTPPYTYEWDSSPIQNTEDITNQCPGTYTVIVTDQNGCTQTAAFEILDVDQITISGTSNTVCNGDCDGSIDISVSGGTGVYSYLWDTSPAQNSQYITDLCAGTYTVVVTDQNGCTAIAAFSVDEYSLIVIAYNILEPSCDSSCDGSIIPTISGGVPPYSFLWNTGNTNGDITGICAGDYALTVTDAVGCSATDNMVVGEPDVISITFEATDPTCNGSCDGSIDINVEGGTGAFSFAWSNGDNTEDISDLCVGEYTLTVTDENGCEEILLVTLAEPDEVVCTHIVDDLTCNGICNGTIDITLTGGTPPFQYTWSNGSTEEDQNDLCAGTYSLTVTDDNGCTSLFTFDLSEPSPIDITGTSVDATCGECNGAIDLTVSGGVAPYSFQWSGVVQDVEDPSELCAGSYSVTVTDANGCTEDFSISVNTPNMLAVTGTVQDTECFGACTGSINITVTGGTSPYVFQWDNGLPPTEDQFNLCTGDYSVFVTDANGCSVIDTFTVEEPEALMVSGIIEHPSCFGDCNGSIQSTVAGGTPPYSYEWSNGSGEADVLNLCAGSYSLIVTDMNGCTASVQFDLEEAEPVEPVITGNLDFCEGSSTVLDAGSGYSAYSWSNGSSSQTITVNTSGEYCVTVTDFEGCTGSTCVIVAVNNAPVIQVTGTDESSQGAGDGTATATISSGSGPFTYVWNTSPVQNTSMIENLSPGTYCATVTDVNGCAAESCVEIGSSGCNLEGNISTTDISCNGENDGSATVNVTGGTEPYSYNWSTGSGEMSIINLTTGMYSVVVTDTNGCSITLETFISEPEPIQVTATVSNPTCFGLCDGIVALNVFGGTPPYTYQWDGPCEGPNPNDVCAGTFTVTVTDANGCTAMLTVTLTEPTQLIVDVTTIDETSSGANDGSATAITNGTGTPGYTYLWSTGAITPTIEDLSPGTYCVTVTDSNGCTASTCGEVGSDNCTLSGNISTTNVNCNGGSSGAATANVSGGTEPYSYNWSTGSGEMSIINLTAGPYSVVVTDADGCSITLETFITEPEPIQITATVSNPTCFGICDGIVALNVFGGTPPYAYEWDGPCEGPNPNDVCAGIFTVTVTDANGCTAIQSVTLASPPELILNMSATGETTMGANDGTASSGPVGGAPPYTFLWNDPNAQTTETATNLAPGEYCVTVTDANGCTKEGCTTVNEAGCTMTLAISASFITCFDDCDGSIDLTVNEGVAPFTYTWSDVSIGNIEDPNGLCAGNYAVIVSDGNQCSATISIVIESNPEITGILVYSDNSCSPACTGMVDATIMGGVEPYTYAWSTGQTTEDIFELCEVADYILTVTDAEGCTAVFSDLTIVTPNHLEASINQTDISCFEACDGSLSVTTIGGTPPYMYDWTPDDYDGQNELTDLCTGTYDLVITDAGGCTITLSALLDEPTELVADVSTTDACFGNCDGTVSVVASGGTPPYSYVLPDNPEQLCPGIYTMIVTDANGCSVTSQFSILESTALSYTLDLVTNENDSQNNGSIDISVSGGTLPYSFSWSDGSTVVSTDEDPTGLAMGMYTCEITDANGCLLTTEVIVVDNIVNTFEISWQDQIRVYPNPVNGLLNIQYTLKDPLDVQLGVFDIRGVSVLVQNSKATGPDQLEFGHLPNGVYTLRISSAESYFTFKIVKTGW